MKPPTEFELLHFLGQLYDPAKAHAYYEKHKHLKGRQNGQAEAARAERVARASVDPRKGKTKEQIHKNARVRQRKELSDQIQGMEQRLNKLEALIKKREHEATSEDRKGKAKKERAAKEADKPKTAAEKADVARESKKDRAKNQQELKTKAKQVDSKSGGSSKKDGKKFVGKHTVAELKSLATKVKGQIQAAKQKLAAL